MVFTCIIIHSYYEHTTYALFYFHWCIFKRATQGMKQIKKPHSHRITAADKSTTVFVSVLFFFRGQCTYRCIYNIHAACGILDSFCGHDGHSVLRVCLFASHFCFFFSFFLHGGINSVNRRYCANGHVRSFRHSFFFILFFLILLLLSMLHWIVTNADRHERLRWTGWMGLENSIWTKKKGNRSVMIWHCNSPGIRARLRFACERTHYVRSQTANWQQQIDWWIFDFWFAI